VKWTATRPTAEGRHRWRQGADSRRVHAVRVRTRKGQPEYSCNTMDLRQVMAGGEWCEEATTEVVEGPEA